MLRIILSMSGFLLVIPIFFSCGPKETPKFPKDAEKEVFQANQDYLARKFDTALEVVDKVIKNHPEYLPAALLKGKILFFTKRPKEAYAVFAAILKAEPGHQGALLWAARVAMLDKKTEKDAENYLIHGLNNHPEDFAMHFELGNYYAKVGNMRQAMVEYQKALMMENELVNLYGSYESLLIKHKLTDRAAKLKAKRTALEVSKEQ